MYTTTIKGPQLTYNKVFLSVNWSTRYYQLDEIQDQESSFKVFQNTINSASQSSYDSLAHYSTCIELFPVLLSRSRDQVVVHFYDTPRRDLDVIMDYELDDFDVANLFRSET